jgi:hypothetical protein
MVIFHHTNIWMKTAIAQNRYEPADSLRSDGDYRGQESIGLVGIFVIVVGIIFIANAVKWFFKTAENNPWFDKVTLYGFLALCAYNVYYCSKH